MQKLVEVALEDGGVLVVAGADIDAIPIVRTTDDRTPSAKALSDSFGVDDLIEPLRQVGRELRARLAELEPSKVTFEAGLAVGVKSGRLTPILVDSAFEGSLKVTLEWDHVTAPPAT